jgi:hypothetical protein
MMNKESRGRSNNRLPAGEHTTIGEGGNSTLQENQDSKVR